jgi:hypothetical protein
MKNRIDREALFLFVLTFGIAIAGIITFAAQWIQVFNR